MRDNDDDVTKEAVYRPILEHAADLIFRTDADRRRIYVSSSSHEILGYSPDELLQQRGYDLVHPDDRDDVARNLAKIGQSYPWVDITFRARRDDGSYIWLEGRFRHVPEDGGLIGFLRDVTVRKGLEEALAESNAKLIAANQILQGLADHDGLTGLWNRRRFDQALMEEIGRSHRQETSLALMLVDIDCFTLFNNRFGHLLADELLCRISKLAAGTMLRPGDHLSRYAGDKIAAILPNTDGQGAMVPARRLCASVAELGIEHPDNPHSIVTVSIGVSSLLPVSSTDSVDLLVSTAEAALQRAKAHGRNLACSFADHEPRPLGKAKRQAPASRRAIPGFGITR
jgi:diguanylate cyclase (GGDEF)-like protein/PAS domain S-box-containing protein